MNQAITERLIEAGYAQDIHIKKCLNWLLSFRQDDGGWAIPIRTLRKPLEDLKTPKTLQPDKSKPHSHLITGMVLRAFTAHPTYKKKKEVWHAGELLAERFFKPDKYADRRTPEYWSKVSYPFLWTDILSSLDSLSKIGFKKDHLQIKKALDWLLKKQKKDGLWNLKIMMGKDKELPLWIDLAVCKVLKRLL